MREITKTYNDPLDLIWLHAAAEMGLRVERSGEVNASYNGAGVLMIGTTETLDPDDTLAQMILHETCHALCEGPGSLHKPDWGLGEADHSKTVHEHACLRLQAALADTVNMRAFFAATTMFRSYYDSLPPEPLAGTNDPAAVMANAGWRRATNGPWGKPILEALQRTAKIAHAINDITPVDSLWNSEPSCTMTPSPLGRGSG